MKPDLTNAIQREIAKLLVSAYINDDRLRERLRGGTYYFYPHNFGSVFQSLEWDEDCCIEVEVRLAKTTKEKS